MWYRVDSINPSLDETHSLTVGMISRCCPCRRLCVVWIHVRESVGLLLDDDDDDDLFVWMNENVMDCAV